MADFRLASSFVLGYHGCTKKSADEIISGSRFKLSKNDYDWLGHGIYFWESNPERAESFIKEVCRRKNESDKDIAVLGAAIDLGYCLDLLSEASISVLRQAYVSFEALTRAAGEPMPKNEGGRDLLKRFLDCAVANYLHASRREEGLSSFQTVRGLFIEGEPIYPNAGFHSKTHVQICVRRRQNIKGVFRVA